MGKKRSSARKQRGLRGSNALGQYEQTGARRAMGIGLEGQSAIPAPRSSGLISTEGGFVPQNMSVPDGLSRASFPIGQKVVRGPAWCGGRMMYGEQDGGAGSVGTVIELPPQLAAKPEHASRQWVCVHWLRTDVIGTYRGSGTGYAGIFDVVPWDGQENAPQGTDASRMVDICDAYQRRQISRDEFHAELGRTGCPPGMEDQVIAMVESKGMTNAAEPAAASAASDRLLPYGASVMLSGLVNASHLNGQIGVLKNYDPRAQRYEVELVTTKKLVRVKPACLGLIESKEEVDREELMRRTGCRIPGGSSSPTFPVGTPPQPWLQQSQDNRLQ